MTERDNSISRALCAAPDCEDEVLALGFCPKHYYRFKKRGTTELPPKPAPRQCYAEACDRKATRKGLCGKHYQRMIDKGSIADPVPRERKKCSVDGCESRHKGHGYCATHLSRVKRHGDPSVGKVEARKANAVKSHCVQCNDPIVKLTPSHKFCSDRCRKRHKQGLPDKVACSWCGNEFKQASGWIFCSKACRSASRRLMYKKLKAAERATAEGKRRHLEANARYILRNRDKVREYYREKLRTDPSFRMATLMRSMVRRVLNATDQGKVERCTEMLGYTSDELRKHIERQFSKGMCWEKVGSEIHIDHIVPVAWFLRQGETDPAVINAITNLRPLWAKDNMAKSDRITHLI